jgi:membrane-associated phospholipid phosphatase
MNGVGGRLRGNEIAGLYGRKIRFFGFDLQITDAFVLWGLIIQAALFLLYGRRINQPLLLAAKNAGLAALYIFSIFLLTKVKSRVLYFILRTGSVQLSFAYLYGAIHPLQLMLMPWQDGTVLAAEQAIFGVQPTLWLERFISTPLTEWMMFSYVIYLVIYPLVAGLIYFKRGERALEDYLFTLGFVNLACDIGFILYPVAGPVFFMPEAYSVPQQGGIFTYLGYYIRTHAHEAGGSIPSPHCAVATVMWLMSRRYVRRWFTILAPIILSLYVSTVYCRYHYITDSIAGIALGIIAILAGPSMVRAWNRRADRRRPKENG